VGQHVILLCDSISCWIMGYMRLRQHLNACLGIDLGATTADGQFTLLPVPCLGTCDHAPALMIGDELYRDLTPDKLDVVLERYGCRREADGATAHPEHQAR
jgi:NADH-quinone oxidoreductase subunit E